MRVPRGGPSSGREAPARKGGKKKKPVDDVGVPSKKK